MTTEEYQEKRKIMLGEAKDDCEYSLRNLKQDRGVLRAQIRDLEYDIRKLDAREKELRQRLECIARDNSA